MKNAKEVHIGMVFEKDLWKKITRLADSAGVTSAFVVRRALIAVVNQGRIPWPTDNEIEKRENEKWGTATPVFDASVESQVKGAEGGKKGRVVQTPSDVV